MCFSCVFRRRVPLNFVTQKRTSLRRLLSFSPNWSYTFWLECTGSKLVISISIWQRIQLYSYKSQNVHFVGGGAVSMPSIAINRFRSEVKCKEKSTGSAYFIYRRNTKFKISRRRHTHVVQYNINDTNTFEMRITMSQNESTAKRTYPEIRNAVTLHQTQAIYYKREKQSPIKSESVLDP